MRAFLLLALAACQQGEVLEPGPVASDEPACPEGLSLGMCAPDFELPSAQGGTERLSDYRGQRVLVISSGMG